MQADDPTGYRSDLLIERIAELFGFDRLSVTLFGPDRYPPYLFAAVGLAVEYGFFDLYNYFVAGKSSFLTSPNSLAIPAMTFLAIFGSRYIHDSYASAVVDLGIDSEHTDVEASRFEGLVSMRVRTVAYAVALVGYYSFVVFALGVSQLVEISGIGLVLYAQLVTFPLIIVPALVELAISYLAVHVAVPRRIARSDLGLFFYDPRNLGGFEPVGELLKRSYYIYTAVLLLWFLQTHTPIILAGVLDSPYPAPGPVYQLALTAAWFAGVVTIAYSMYRVHSIMSGHKQRRIRSLEDELKRAVEDPYDAHLTNIDDRERYDDARENLTQVHQTKTYPTTFTMWSQLLLSVLLPQALNMVVQLPG